MNLDDVIIQAIRAAPALDTNGYLAEKSEVIKSVTQALASHRSSVGGEWVLVPREPTEAMVRNACYTRCAGYACIKSKTCQATPDEARGKTARIYAAYLSAAPPPPAPGEEREAIARIVDPIAYRDFPVDGKEPAHDWWDRAQALAKADQIIALRSPSLIVGGEDQGTSIASRGGTASPKSDSDGGL